MPPRALPYLSWRAHIARVALSCAPVFAAQACEPTAAPAAAAAADDSTAPARPTSGVAIAVHTASRFPISRFVYGMNLLTDVDGPYAAGSPWYGARPPATVTLSRMGGNRLTAYNWETNFSNAGADYRFQNDGFLSASTRPGEAVRSRVAAARAQGAATIVTVPMIGYVAGDAGGVELDVADATRAARLAAHFVASRPSTGAPFGPAPDVADGVVYQDEFVHWLERTFPGSSTDAATPVFYSLDNEPDIWHVTHAEILSNEGDDPDRPRLQTYDGFVRTTVDYARAIKRVAPGAQVFGPAVATWAGIQNLGRYPHADPVHGTRPFVEVYLERLRQAEAQHGRRLVDVLDVHWYPAVGTRAGAITNDYAPQDAAMIEQRLQAPRSLWDPTYDEESWVTQTAGGPIAILPRLRRLIDAHYPGTKLAITEYYYGRGGDISGGIAQADVLGIFGREGVYAAALWPQAGVWAAPYEGDGAAAYAFVFGAFRMFRDYDGRGGRFGDTGVRATTSDPVRTSAYASLDAEGRVVLVAINKTEAAVPAAITVAHPAALRTARVYTLTAASPMPDEAPSPAIGAGNALTYTMPAMSVSTLVLAP